MPQRKGRTAPPETVPPPSLEGEEAVLYHALSFEPKHIDVLIEESAKGAPEVSALLLALELKGAVRQMAGKYYVKI